MSVTVTVGPGRRAQAAGSGPRSRVRGSGSRRGRAGPACPVVIRHVHVTVSGAESSHGASEFCGGRGGCGRRRAGTRRPGLGRRSRVQEAEFRVGGGRHWHWATVTDNFNANSVALLQLFLLIIVVVLIIPHYHPGNN